MDIVCGTEINKHMYDRVLFHKYFSLNIGCIETVQINNQTIIHFVNLFSREVSIDVSYPIIVNPIYGYLNASISPSSVSYIFTIEKPMQ